MLDYQRMLKEEVKRRRRRRLFLIVALVVLVGGSGACVALVRSSLFQIEGVFVEPSSAILAPQLANAAGQQLNRKNLWERIVFNDNNIILAKFNQKRTEQDLTMSYPMLERLRVTVDTVSRRVFFTVTERERYGLWCVQPPAASEPHACWWFDRNGIAFLEGPIAQGALINKVIDRSGTAVTAGTQVLPAEQASNLASIYNLLELSGIGIKTLIREVSQYEEVRTADPAYPTFIFSLRENALFALKPLEELKSSFPNLEYIDLSVKNRVYFK